MLLTPPFLLAVVSRTRLPHAWLPTQRPSFLPHLHDAISVLRIIGLLSLLHGLLHPQHQHYRRRRPLNCPRYIRSVLPFHPCPPATPSTSAYYVPHIGSPHGHIHAARSSIVAVPASAVVSYMRIHDRDDTLHFGSEKPLCTSRTSLASSAYAISRTCTPSPRARRQTTSRARGCSGFTSVPHSARELLEFASGSGAPGVEVRPPFVCRYTPRV